MEYFSFNKKLKLKIICKKNPDYFNEYYKIYNELKFYKSMNLYKVKDDNLKKALINRIKKLKIQLQLLTLNQYILSIKYKMFSAEYPIISNILTKSEYIEILNKFKLFLKNRRNDIKKTTPLLKKIRNTKYASSTIGGVHINKNEIYQLVKPLGYDKVNSPRFPTDNENNIGIEIEFYSEYNRDYICNELIKRKLQNNCRIMTDSSIHPSEDKPYAFELCVVSPENKKDDVLKKVCELLVDLDAETNDSCGLHVHLDARYRNVKILFNNLVQVQRILFSLVESSRKYNRYCTPQTTCDWDFADPGHYAAINKYSYSKHKTIEVRIHEGTINLKKIIQWTNLLIKIANYDNVIVNGCLPPEIMIEGA